MQDTFGRNIDYIRLSVIDRCNLRCIYCHDGCYEKMPPDSIMSYEEIIIIVKHLIKRGLKAVRITGGEPLVRKDISFIVAKLVALGIDVSLTTNGTMLHEKAEDLAAAGLRRINIGIDCLDKGLFAKITGFEKLDKVISGINKSIEVGFDPIKINVVLIEGLNDDIEPWIKFAKENPVTVRFIEVMPFVNGFKPVKNDYIFKRLEKIGDPKEISLTGRGPAKHFSFEGFKGNIGLISSVNESFCDSCTRLRVNAQGQLRGCLYSSHTHDYLSLVRNGFSDEKLRRLVDEVLESKPKDKNGLQPVENMCQIGG